jgi:hypothetical protein
MQNKGYFQSCNSLIAFRCDLNNKIGLFQRAGKKENILLQENN